MRYHEILLEDYKTSAKKYIDGGNDPELVKSVILQFRQIQPRISDINLKNIDWWAKNRTFQHLRDYVANFEGIPTKNQMGKKTGRSRNLIENSEWLIVVPLDKDASCFHGKTTDWCTTKPFRGYYEEYFYDNRITLIYCLQKSSGNKWAIAAHNKHLDSTEYFDVNDTPLSKGEFEKQTGLQVDKILTIAFGKDVQTEVETSRTNYSDAITRIKELIREIEKTNKQNSEIENLLWLTKHKGYLKAYMSLVGPANFNKNLEIYAVNTIGGSAITYIANPSEKVQLIAAKEDGFTTLNYLLNIYGEDKISDEVKLLCVKDAPNIIGKLKHQSEEMKRVAIETGAANLQLINPPLSDELKMLSVQKRPSSIRFIENPSEEMQILAVKDNGDRLNDLLNNVSKITPSNQVLIASVSNTNADSAIDKMIMNDITITDEIITTALKNSDDPKSIIGMASVNDIELSIGAQIAAVSNMPHTIYSLYAEYDGKVSEAVQMVAAREGGASFLAETYRYIITTRKMIDVSSHAIEEAFKNTLYLTHKMMKNMVTLSKNMGDRFTAFPTFTAFKNAIDGLIKEEINSEVIEVLQLSFTYGDLHDRVVDYAQEAAKKSENTMLQRMIIKYKEENDLDNLSFEPAK